jgi:hypothetical protein
VAYTLKGDATLHTLALKGHELALVFGDAANWHVFEAWPDGHFAPAGS